MKNLIIANYKLLIVLIGLVVLLCLVYIITDPPLTDLENILLQVIFLAVGCSVSFFVGQKSVEKAAKEIIKPHARSAFRRLISLYESLSRASTEIQSLDNSESLEDYRVALAKFDAIVTEQLNTADDALEDWRDIVPEDVEELKQKLESKIQGGIDSDSNPTNSQ
ncbi:hypothetical protein F4X90_09005 [Candidatus Poribacteria bacterium]|nr:hypothetical protein [Candidatus Poribacteria bacterium]